MQQKRLQKSFEGNQFSLNMISQGLFALGLKTIFPLIGENEDALAPVPLTGVHLKVIYFHAFYFLDTGETGGGGGGGVCGSGVCEQRAEGN